MAPIYELLLQKENYHPAKHISWEQTCELMHPDSASGGGDFWQKSVHTICGLSVLDHTPQHAHYHAEGSVGIHVRMMLDVFAQYKNVPYPTGLMSLSTHKQQCLLWAILLHDIAKGQTSTLDENGHWRHPHHSTRGAIDARVILWNLGAPPEVIETVAYLVLHHQKLYHLPLEDLRAISQLAIDGPLELLFLLCKIDLHGRITSPASIAAEALEHLELLWESAYINGLITPTPVSDGAFWFLNTSSAKNIPYSSAFERPIVSTRGHLTLLHGPTGAGKSHYCAKHIHTGAILSLDNLRKGKWNIGTIKRQLRDELSERLAASEHVALDNTHLDAQDRSYYIELAHQYEASTRLLQIIPPPAHVWQSRLKKRSTLNWSQAVHMLMHWQRPGRYETHQGAYIDGQRGDILHEGPWTAPYGQISK